MKTQYGNDPTQSGYAYPEGTICELPPPLRYPPKKMKKTKPKSDEYDTQTFQASLHKALEAGDREKAFDAMCRMLSHYAAFTDYYTRFPEDWDRMEELRGR